MSGTTVIESDLAGLVAEAVDRQAEDQKERKQKQALKQMFQLQ
mgnify:CR=1 FL=1